MLTQYKAGGSLDHDDPTYVVRSCDNELYHSLKAGEFCYVFNSCQMGKSSLLVRIKHQLEAEGYCCATVDMTRIGSQDTTPLQWYKGMIVDLLRGFRCLGQLNLKAWWQQPEEISLVQKLGDFLELLLLEYFPQQHLCIFIDEIDSILNLSFSIDDFFALIQSCYQQRAINPEYKRLTFAVFGVTTSNLLMIDKSRTPFNLGKAIHLTGFTPEESVSLTQGLHGKVERPKAVLKAILAWTNGQPFLTQKLFLLFDLWLLNQKHNITGKEKFWIDSIVKLQIIKMWESQDEPEHLRTIRDRILHNYKLLKLYQKLLQGFEIITDDSQEQTDLILSGLVMKIGNQLTIKNKIYQSIFNLEWVKEQLSSLSSYSQD